jgi:outer membrane protein OmpA-like peptidoglycan-associated protein
MRLTENQIVRRRPTAHRALATRGMPHFRLTMMWVLLAGLVLAFTACASMSRKEEGAVIGAAAGGAVGGVIGKNNGSTARGAIIGAVIGGAAGAVIGHQMDQQAKELKLEIPGATIERVGEGIQVTFASGLLYDFDSDSIRLEPGLNLRTLATSLKKYANTQLLIVGHTDAVGSDTYNQDLSTRRANSASTYLTAQGVSAGRLHSSGRGELEPVGSNGTDAGRQMNRRIEVAIFSGAAR